MIRRAHLVIAIATLSACRMDVQLEAHRDAAPRDALVLDASRTDARAFDAFALPDAALDAPDLDAGPLPPVCAGPGLALGSVAVTPASLAPVLSIVGAGDAQRYAVLVPPSARPLPTTLARLVVLDARADVVADREIEVASGGAALLALPDASTTAGEEAFVVIVGDQLSFFDANGEVVGDAVRLPRAIAPAHQASLAWLDDTHLVYVSTELSIVSFDRTARGASVSTAVVSAVDDVFLAPGSVVINRGEPMLETIELSSTLDGTETVHLVQPEPHAGFVIGAFRIGAERRWVVRANEEFRTQPKLIRVEDDGTVETITGDIVVMGPPDTTQRDGLVAIGGTDGAVIVVDPDAGTFRTLVAPGAQQLAAIARGPDGIAALVVEPGDPDARLVLRCEL
ncbi:MAG: hypothetical protein J0L92_40955 [Deltaproteobacteria bacterium]|nr:hypothetical protein [Deltaproteobacteria bacterium]